MTRAFDEYSTRYEHVAMSRQNGVIELRLHTDGGPLVWGDGPHTELGYAFADVGADQENRVVVLGGTGDAFIDRMDSSWVGRLDPEMWAKIYFHGRRLLLSLLDIEVPVISVVNGPARIHSEIALLGDIVIGTPTSVIQDAPHFKFGTVPSDGVHVVFTELLGINRARSFLLLAEKIQADEAKRLGIYHSVEPDAEAAWAKARELAAGLAAKPPGVVRYTRLALTHRYRQKLFEGLTLGLALEGLGAYESWPTAEE